MINLKIMPRGTLGFAMPTKHGLFISVEGIDGAGKTTHVELIKGHLEQRGYEVIITREPGGTMLGEDLRNILLHSRHNMHYITELLLMFASRQELIHNVIMPNLNQGICIISDRFIHASIAYQGYGRGIDIKKID
jgi:dTMP kinase